MPPTKPVPGAVVRSLSVRRLPRPREEAVALTVLQPATQYAALLRWCDQVVAEHRPSPHDVVRAMVVRLLADPELAADVAADLRENLTADDLAGYICW